MHLLLPDTDGPTGGYEPHPPGQFPAAHVRFTTSALDQASDNSPQEGECYTASTDGNINLPDLPLRAPLPINTIDEIGVSASGVPPTPPTAHEDPANNDAQQLNPLTETLSGLSLSTQPQKTGGPQTIEDDDFGIHDVPY